MNKLVFLTTLTLWNFSPCLTHEPAQEARKFFSEQFIGHVFYYNAKNNTEIVMSPAAIQKFLIACYKGMENTQSDSLLFDLQVKHIASEEIFNKLDKIEDPNDYLAAFFDLRAKRIQELKTPLIEKAVVLNFFKTDFKDTSNFIKVNNYIVVPQNLQAKPEYKNFVKEYFNVDIVHSKTDDEKHLQTKFGVPANEDDKVALYSNVELNLKLANSRKLSDENVLLFNGKAKYFENTETVERNVGGINKKVEHTRQYIELDLENDLKLLILVGSHAELFEIIARLDENFLPHFNDKLEMKTVKVTIPLINIESINDLAVHFKQIYGFGLGHALEGDAKLSEAFENWPVEGPNIQHIWQRAALKIEPSTANSSSPAFTAETDAELITLNAINKNFFFAIKDDKCFYAMGYVGELK